MSGWIGVDLDGTLAEYHGWDKSGGIGAPIEKMAARVRKWLAEGKEVRIMTARVAACNAVSRESNLTDDEHFANEQSLLIEGWCMTHFGVRLPVTAKKDFSMYELWDDRAIQIIPNTGVRADGKD